MTNDTSRNSDTGADATVRKVYVQDLKERDRVHTVFRVTRKELITARSGKTFLSLTFTDRTGHVDGRVFDRAGELHPTFLVDDYVLVSGNVSTFRGNNQVVAEAIERLEPGPIDAAEFTPPPDAPRPSSDRPASDKKEKDREKASAREKAPAAAPRGERTSLRAELENLSEGPIRSVLLALVEDGRVAEGLRRGGKGGRASHEATVEGQLQLVLAVSGNYPQASVELLVAGVVLGGVARALENGDEARLVGGSVLAAQKLHEKSRQAEVPFPLAHQLAHLVLALDDPRDGSAGRPALTLEAELVRTLVSMDLRLQHWTELLERGGEGHWTRPLEDGRTLLRTSGAPSREKKPRRERKPRGEKAQPDNAGNATGEPPLRAPRPARELPGDLSFKPFSALTALAPEPEPTPEAAPAPTEAAPAPTESSSGSNGAEAKPQDSGPEAG